jgi:quinoprotein glucose dehydrogenase
MGFVDRLIPRSALGPDGRSDLQTGQETGGINPNYGAPFAVELRPFLSPWGLPCQAPPWGYVAGVDLKSGKIVWRHKNGTVRDSSPVPLPFKMGVPSLGGPIVTAGGVAFLTATLDYYIRSYDVATGRQLWEERLPAGAQATPVTYRSDRSGRQFVVVVAGGHGSLGTKAGDAVIAYALPKS